MTSPRSGLRLDPNDPTDRQIIARQVQAARRAGRDGRDRAASTRGRADLEEAYDEGAAQASGERNGSPPAGGGGGKGSGGKPAWTSPASSRLPKGPSWRSLKPTSPASLPSRWSDAGGFITGIALYTVVIIYVRHGPAGWKGWLKAKFLNQPMTDGATGGTGTKPKTKKGKAAAV